jgi:plasmid stabilization system protein ParE
MFKAALQASSGMDSKRIEFHEEASKEYEAAFDWYLARSELAASKFAQELERAISLIAKAPRRWPEAIGGWRQFRLERFPFSIVCRELPSNIQIIAVAHGHRRPGYWKQRF